MTTVTQPRVSLQELSALARQSISIVRATLERIGHIQSSESMETDLRYWQTKADLVSPSHLAEQRELGKYFFVLLPQN
jgi:hypothetical protein